MAVLEVAIGVVFFYVTLSLFCTTLGELWSRNLEKRGKLLEKGIERMLSGLGPSRIAEVLTHPLIATAPHAGQKPTRVDARAFARALLERLTGGAGNVQEVEACVKKIGDVPVRHALAALCAGTNVTLEELQQRIAAWFDEVMVQATESYKRTMGNVALVVAIGLAVALNADTLMLIQTLWREPALRATLVAEAEQATRRERTPDDLREQLAVTREELSHFPIGWPTQDFAKDPRGLPDTNFYSALLLKLLGIAMTVVAMTLGAPFWFDLLRLILNLRSGTAPPEAPKP